MRAVEGYDSISAEVRQEVSLFDRHLVGSGHYWEQRRGRGRLLRLELKIQLGDQISSLVQVCDGRFLWTKRKLLGNAKLTRLDVAEATRGLERAEATLGRGKMEMLPGLGGLPKLLRGLHAYFDFSTAEPGRWGREKRPVWRLLGRWKPEQLAKILPDQKEAIEAGRPPDLDRLPEHLPDHVVLLLGQQDLFPYRLEYRRAVTSNALRSDAPESRPLVTMQLFNVALNDPIDPMRFDYNPGNVEHTDQTDSFLQSLGVEE